MYNLQILRENDVMSKKIVLTGGPCAGKTTLTQVISKVFSHQIEVVPETASLLFRGGFPRWNEVDAKKSTQRAIYNVQIEIEKSFEAHFPQKKLILDRATLDGAVYWPDGVNDFFAELNTSLQLELKRYDLVLYLESAGEEDYLSHQKDNPYRTETWEQAKKLDEETKNLWSQHLKFFFIPNSRSFDAKIVQALAILQNEICSSKK